MSDSGPIDWPDHLDELVGQRQRSGRAAPNRAEDVVILRGRDVVLQDMYGAVSPYLEDKRRHRFTFA